MTKTISYEIQEDGEDNTIFNSDGSETVLEGSFTSQSTRSVFEDAFNSIIPNAVIEEAFNVNGSKALLQEAFLSEDSDVIYEEAFGSRGSHRNNSDESEVKLLYYGYENTSETEEMLNSQGSNTNLNLHKNDMERGKKRKARVVAIAMALVGSLLMLLLCAWLIFFSFTGNIPEWHQENFMIESIPGLRYRPKPPATYSKGTLIAFKATDAEEYNTWTEIINNFLEVYRKPKHYENLYSCDYDRLPYGDKVCYVDVKNWFPCTQENHFNYHRSSPCVFIKFNEIQNWVPEYYNDTKYLPADMPNDLKEYIVSQKMINPQLLKTVWISCQGENPADKEFIGTIDYLPQRGFPGYYFPYNASRKGYLSPLVAVHFERIMTGVLVNIECRLWAPNIAYDHEKGSGYVHFELMVD